MKNTKFVLWVDDCERNNVQIYQLDYDKATDIGIYMTKSSYWYQNNVYYETPVYHIWQGNNWVASSEDYQEIYKKWEKLVNESKIR